MAEYSLLEGPQGVTLLRRHGDRQAIVATGMEAAEARDALEKLNRGRGLSLGEVFEWLGMAALVAAAYLWHRWVPLALLAFACVMIYEGNCYSTTEIRRPRMPRALRKGVGMVRRATAKLAPKRRRAAQ